MSSQDGPNRSRRTPRTSQQPRRSDAPTRRNQTWDVDPAEIDRYLSGRPSRSDESATQQTRGQRSGTTADQLSRLQNAVGRRQPAQQPEAGNSEPRRPAQQRRAPRRAPEPTYYDDEDGEAEEPVQETYTGRPAGYADAYDDDYDPYANEEDEVRYEPEERPAPRRQQGRPSSTRVTRQRRPARRYEPDPVDVYPDEDDELYNDDPYLGYEDDQIDRRPPRVSRTPRQRSSTSKPNIPSITLPKSMTDSPLLADTPSLVMIGISIVSVALMSFLVSDRISVLGETIATHVSASGEAENIQTRDAIWNIPLLAGMVMLMNIAAGWFISRIDQFATRFLLAAGLLVHFIAWVALFKYLWE